LQKSSAVAEAPLARVTQAVVVLATPTKPDGSADTAGWGTTVGGLIVGPYGAADHRASASRCRFSDWQRRRTQAAAVSMVNGIDAAAASVPGFKQRRIGCRPATETPLAQKIVDKNSLAPLPKAS
jgi:hypothetical protein